MDRRQFLKLPFAAGTTGLMAGYPVFIERYLVQVNTYEIPIARLPRELHGFTIVQLTDLHCGTLMPLSFLRHVIRKANGLGGDVIVCTGDYVNQHDGIANIDMIWPALMDLDAPHGVYSVLGNHDHWASFDHSMYWLERSGQNLRHRTHCLERNGARLWIAGAGDLWEDHVNLDRLLENIPPDDVRLVLAHNPDSADTAFSSPLDLMICGHTHGGQVNVPFYGPPILPVENRTYSSGLKNNPKGQSVFISKGVGWSTYPVRFNCYPEIAVLKLVPAEKNA